MTILGYPNTIDPDSVAAEVSDSPDIILMIKLTMFPGDVDIHQTNIDLIQGSSAYNEVWTQMHDPVVMIHIMEIPFQMGCLYCRLRHNCRLQRADRPSPLQLRFN